MVIFVRTIRGMKTRMGRPPKRPEDSLAARLYVRLSSAEKEALESAAGKADVPLSAWIRLRLLAAAKRENKR